MPAAKELPPFSVTLEVVPPAGPDVEPLLASAPEKSPDRLQGSGEIREEIRRALGKISPKSAEVFILRYFEGYGNHEIARMLGSSRSTINVILHRTRQKIREEIDAMRAIGLDPIEVLVLPRVTALLTWLPILAFSAAMLGVIGGMLVAWSTMGISPVLFFARLQSMVVISNFWVGMIKAPFFAFFIAVIGCYQGLKVAGSAESLGL